MAMRRGSRRLVLMVIEHTVPWLLLGSAAGAPPSSQPAGRLRPGALHLSLAEACVGFESEFHQDRVRYRYPGRDDYVHRNRDGRLRELFGLNLAGDVVDPNLFDWRADLELGATQSWFDEDIDDYDRRARDNAWLHAYDLAFDALKSKPVSLHGYARRSDDRISRRFLPSLEEDVTEAGLSMLALAGPLTTEIGYAFREVQRTGNRLVDDDETLRTSRFYVDNNLRISPSQQLRVNYEHERQESDYQGGRYHFDTTRDELRAEHELLFGDQNRHRLDTVFRYDAEQGDLARDELQLTPRLALRHTDKLQTIYRYSFYQIRQDALEIGQHKLDGQVVYRPTDRWRITGDVYGLYERAEGDVETYEFGGGPDVSYNRSTPWGRFQADFHLAYDHARTTGTAGRRVIRNEAHALSTVRPAYLRHRDALLYSVIAHNREWTRVYVMGVDYAAVVAGRRVYVSRLPFGRIAENEVVYFDYQYDVPAHSESDTYRTDLLIEHEFDFGLTPYYYLETRCEEVDSSRGSYRVRDNQNRHRLGARYGRPRWSVTNEIEIFDDTVEPYDAYHFTGQATILREPSHSLDLAGRLSRYWFEGGVDDRRIWWLEVDVKDRVQINPYWWVDAGAAYHFEHDSRDGRTHGVDVECGVRYVRGLLTVELTGEYNLLAIGQTREEGVGVWVKVRRDLPDLLTAWRSPR